MIRRLLSAAALVLVATSAWAGNVTVGAGTGSCGYAVSAVNVGAAPSCVASPTAAPTATVQSSPTSAPTATPQPTPTNVATATVQPSPTVMPSPTFATVALDNLSAVAVNTALLPVGTGIDLGSTTKPWRHLYFFGTGTSYGTNYARFVMSPTGARDITFQDSSHTVAAANGGNTFTGTNMVTSGSWNYSAGVPLAFPDTSAGGNRIQVRSENTPDAPELNTGTTTNSWIIAETQDAGSDFNNGPCGTSACTDPTIVINSHTPSTTQYQAFSHDTLLAQQYGVNGVTAFGGLKALTESSATTFVSVNVASGSWAGGQIEYTIQASNGTDHQVRASGVKFAVTNKAGTVACQLTTMDGTAGTTINETTDGNAFSITSGTLTYAVTCALGTNAVNIQANAVSSLTQTSLNSYYRVRLNGPGSITGG